VLSLSRYARGVSASLANLQEDPELDSLMYRVPLLPGPSAAAEHCAHADARGSIAHDAGKHRRDRVYFLVLVLRRGRLGTQHCAP
jgi:hypothetical protein